MAIKLSRKKTYIYIYSFCIYKYYYYLNVLILFSISKNILLNIINN